MRASFVRTALLALGLLAPGVAFAQPAPGMVSGFNDDDGAVHRRANPEWLALGMQLQRKQEKRDTQQCSRTGCIFMRNLMVSDDVIGIYINTARMGSNPKWSPNQLRGPLHPGGLVWTFTNGDSTMCGLDFYAVFENRKTHEQRRENGMLSLCSAADRPPLDRDQRLDLFFVPDHSVKVEGDTPDPAKH